MPQLSERAKGLAITTAGMLVLTPDSLLVLLIDLPPWQTLMWRGYLQAFGIVCLVWLFSRGAGFTAFRSIGRAGLCAALCASFANVCFIFAVAHTSVANVLVIVATAPFFAALFSFVFLGERVPLRTWTAIAFTFLGIGVLGWGALGSGSLPGDLTALGTAVGLGAQFTVLRHARRVVMVPVPAVSGVLSGSIGLCLSGFLPGGLSWPEGASLVYILAMGLLVLPVSAALINLGPRYISAAEVALIFLLETFLGPLWVWAVLGQVPATPTFVGGAIVVVTLAVHAALGLRRPHPPPPRRSPSP